MNKYRDERDKFLLDKMVKDILDKYYFAIIDNKYYVWCNHKYDCDTKEIVACIVDRLDPYSKPYHWSRVWNKIKIHEDEFIYVDKIDQCL